MAKLSYSAITVIAICVAGAVVLMILTCAMQLRRRNGENEASTEIHDADMGQLKYMQEVRQRGRIEITGTDPRAWRSDVPSYHSHPSSPGPSRQMMRSALSNHGEGGYGDVYTPGFEQPSMSSMKRQGSSYMHGPDMEYGGIPYGNAKGGMAETTYEASPVAGPGDYVYDDRDEHGDRA